MKVTFLIKLLITIALVSSTYNWGFFNQAVNWAREQAEAAARAVADAARRIAEAAAAAARAQAEAYARAQAEAAAAQRRAAEAAAAAAQRAQAEAAERARAEEAARVRAAQTINDAAYAFLNPDNIFISGKCTLQSKTWDCTVTAGNGFGLDISGAVGNVPAQYNVAGIIRVPYAYITGVTTSQRQWTVGYVRYTERTYYININRLGATDTLVVDQNNPNSVTKFIDNTNANASLKARALGNAKNGVIQTASIFNTQAQFVNSSRNDYTNTVASVADLNQKIQNAANQITQMNAEKNTLTVTNDSLTKAISALLDMRDLSQRVVNTCDAEEVTINNLLVTYMKYKEEFTEDKAFEYLDKQYSYICIFHLNCQDLGLILPNQKLNINKMRKDVSNNKNLQAVKDLFESKDFFVLKDK